MSIYDTTIVCKKTRIMSCTLKGSQDVHRTSDIITFAYLDQYLNVSILFSIMQVTH